MNEDDIDSIESPTTSRRRYSRWVTVLTHLATRRTGWTLSAVGVLTLCSMLLAERLQLNMNWTDLLPSDHPQVRLYRDVLDRFGETSIVIALEGERDSIVAMAEELEPKLHALESLHNVIGKMPVEFLLDHGFVLLKPEQFDRTLRSLENWTVLGSLRGMNDDYEREYTENESNIRRDEVEIARGILGLTRSLELLSAGLAGEAGPEVMVEAADALSIGDPWLLALDRQMLLIAVTPEASTTQIDETLATVAEVDAVMQEVTASHPGVYASMTGMGKISQDEMNSVGGYTVLLSILALLLIYLLLARAFRGWVIPLLALLPLIVGIFWTMAVLQILFGALNLFTAMMMLVLLGLGIDFSIHLISRFQEETARGTDLEAGIATTFAGTGVAVMMGAATTAIAFLTLMVGDTKGVFEFGVAAGLGVVITLIAIFLTLPALLVLRYRRLEKAGAVQTSTASWNHGHRWIGNVVRAGWKHPSVFLVATAIVVAASIWAMRHTAYEYDFLELEAKGLRSVELQRQIPRRFGTSDHSAWLVANSIERSRELKQELRNLPEVGDVNAISDFVPSSTRFAEYAPRLEQFRRTVLTRDRPAWIPGDAARLSVEMGRLWDNLDLISNLAYTAGLDRIVSVIDGITGVDSETGVTDTSALLPTLSRQFANITDDSTLRSFAEMWATHLKQNLHRMSNPAPVSLEEVPDNMLQSFTPRSGEDYLVHVVPRRSLWDRPSLERFASQAESVDPNVIGSEQLMLVMMDATLEDGRNAAFLALAVIALLLIIHFRGPVGLVALVPLVVGTLIMLGMMYALHMKYNYMNLIATPIILGIGIDDGVHALHRYREAGGGSQAVDRSFQSVGRAILLTSLTTMIGFGSVAFYEMRGMASFGQVLFMGVGACFLATVLVLPALLRVVLRQPRAAPIREPGEEVGGAAT
jgi:predicted RND superfamily exporter protein